MEPSEMTEEIIDLQYEADITSYKEGLTMGLCFGAGITLIVSAVLIIVLTVL